MPVWLQDQAARHACVCIIEMAYLLSTEELYFIERGVSPSKPWKYKKVFVGGGRYTLPPPPFLSHSS